MTIARGCMIVLFFPAFLVGSPAPDAWKPVRYFAGAWEGDAQGQPGTGKTPSIWAVQPKNPKGEVHEDWGMISYDRSRKRRVLRQFHVEGFVSQYVALPAGDGPLSFQSESIENTPAGFRARTTCTITGPDEFVERFELAEPGKDFELCIETRFRRKK